MGRHIGRYIPGNPQVVVQNMPGAGSNIAANYIYNVAKKDGTMVGALYAGAPLEPLICSVPLAALSWQPGWLENHPRTHYLLTEEAAAWQRSGPLQLDLPRSSGY